MSNVRCGAVITLMGMSLTFGTGCPQAPMAVTKPASAPPPVEAAAPSERPASLIWSECDPPVEGAECATMSAPVSYATAAANPDAGTIGIALMRFVTGRPNAPRLWFLAGGPGGSGTSLLPLLHKRYGDDLADVDLYTIDHRGTGGSRRLSCPEQESPGSPGALAIVPAEVAPCVEHLRNTHGELLDHIDVNSSARDVARALAGMGNGAADYLWGNSFGTHWALRVAESFPQSIDGAILEALVPHDASYRSFDFWMNDAGMRLMKRCAADPSCVSALGEDPMGLAKRLPARLAEGHCGALDFPVPVTWFLGSMLYDHGLRGMLPRLVQMIDRCGEDDVRRLKHMYAALFRDQGMLTAGDFSTPLYAHVTLSELWGAGPPGDASLTQVASTCLFCPADRHHMDLARTSWPRSTAATWPPAVLRYRGPLWMLQGRLDPGIDPAVTEALGSKYQGAHQHFIMFPTGAHALMGKTPSPSGDCALGLMRAFVADPTAPPPVACVKEVQPPSLPDGPPGLASALFGTAASR